MDHYENKFFVDKKTVCENFPNYFSFPKYFFPIQFSYNETIFFLFQQFNSIDSFLQLQCNKLSPRRKKLKGKGNVNPLIFTSRSMNGDNVQERQNEVNGINNGIRELPFLCHCPPMNLSRAGILNSTTKTSSEVHQSSWA